MRTAMEMMTEDPFTLEPEATLRDALERLTAKGVSGAPVVSGRKLVGVISTSDLLDFEADQLLRTRDREEENAWEEWTAANVVGEDIGESPATFFQELWAASTADLATRIAEPGGEDWDALSAHQVGEVMTRTVLAVSPHTEASEIARLMVARGVHRVLVVEGEELSGIISAFDFVRGVAGGRFIPSP